MPAPPIAVGTDSAPAFLVEAVVAGGARVVEAHEAEGLVWGDPRDVAGLRAALADGAGIRWVQLPWAGVEAYADAGMFGDGRTWTSGKGVYAEPVAELALALGLGGLRDVPRLARATTWGPETGRPLMDGRVTVVGGGGICEALLALLVPFRVETTVVRRRPAPMAGATRVVGPDGLHGALEDADLVVLACALTPETRGIIDQRALAAMAPHAWLVNVARGAVVVTDHLVEALHAGVIGGAALDVTEPEPLPDGHPLWTLANCIVTPHTADTPEMARRLLAARVTDNVRRFSAGDALVGVVDPVLGY